MRANRDDDDDDDDRGNRAGECRRSEIAISWNQTEPQGPAGPPRPQSDTGATEPAGPAGPVGPAGPAGPPGPQSDTGERGPAEPAGPQSETGDTEPAGPPGPQSEIGETEPQGPTGPPGPAGPQGPAGPSLASQMCPTGEFVTGVSASGNIICSSSCPSGELTFHITSVVVATLHNWPGRTVTQNSSAGCSVTVSRPSGNISVGSNAWEIVSTTGFNSANGSGGCRSAGASARFHRSRAAGRSARTRRTSSHPVRRRTTSWTSTRGVMRNRAGSSGPARRGESFQISVPSSKRLEMNGSGSPRRCSVVFADGVPKPASQPIGRRRSRRSRPLHLLASRPVLRAPHPIPLDQQLAAAELAVQPVRTCGRRREDPSVDLAFGAAQCCPSPSRAVALGPGRERPLTRYGERG